jgi:hypothetical protein
VEWVPDAHAIYGVRRRTAVIAYWAGAASGGHPRRISVMWPSPALRKQTVLDPFDVTEKHEKKVIPDS